MTEDKYDGMYMTFAMRAALESKCPRKQVGCCILLPSGMLSIGFNGMAPGDNDEWEDEGVSNTDVVHAELNSLGKMLEEGVSAKGASVFLTLSPCKECSKLLVRANVKRVVYVEEYRDIEGIEYLQDHGVAVEKFHPRVISLFAVQQGSHSTTEEG